MKWPLWYAGQMYPEWSFPQKWTLGTVARCTLLRWIQVISFFGKEGKLELRVLGSTWRPHGPKKSQWLHLGLLPSTVHPLPGPSPSWTGRVAGSMGGFLKEFIMIPNFFTHFFFVTPFSWALTFMDWARGGDNGGIMRQGGLLTVAQHCLPIVTRWAVLNKILIWYLFYIGGEDRLGYLHYIN